MKERTRNKLKDYIVLAPALHVTHLLAFTLTEVAPSLRVIRLPGGPTLSFRVERYSLVKDMLSSVRRAKSIGLEYLSPPLVSRRCGMHFGFSNDHLSSCSHPSLPRDKTLPHTSPS